MLLLRHSRLLDSGILVNLSIAEKGRTKAYIRIARVLQGFRGNIIVTPCPSPRRFSATPRYGLQRCAMIARCCPVYEVRWLSGRKRRTRNAVCQRWYLGFESLTHLHRHSGFAVQPGSRLLGALSPPFPETGNLQNSVSGARSAAIIFFRVTRVTPPKAEKPVAAESGYFGIKLTETLANEHAHGSRKTFQRGAGLCTQSRGWWCEFTRSGKL
jgi:hypothetical protein